MKTGWKKNRHRAGQLIKTSFAEVYLTGQVEWKATYVSRETEDN